MIVLTLACSVTAALADPVPPNPCSGRVLPIALCVRIVDIERKNDGAFFHTFDFELEFMNWTGTPADAIDVSIAEPGVSTIVFLPAPVDPNGRPLHDPGVNEDANNNGIIDAGEDANGNGRLDTPNRPPCNQNTATNWVPTVQTGTRVKWERSADSVVPNIDLLNCAGKTQAQIDALIPCTNAGACMPCTVSHVTGAITPTEAIDDGTNARDGFILRVQNFLINQTLNLNWFLVAGGSSIGKAGFGNQYGFGVLTITRSSVLNPPVFMGQSGAQTGGAQFFDSVFNAIPGASVLGFGGIEPEAIDSTFSFEPGAGITAVFRNASDNVYGAPINAVLINPPEPPVEAALSRVPGFDRVKAGLAFVVLLGLALWMLRKRSGLPSH
jgi:hypothetical protein